MTLRFDFELLELRQLLSAAAFDLIGVTALRHDPNFADIDGRGVSVAVIDTGLDKTHPLLAPNYVAGADIVNGGSNPTPTNPHGTHVAGIIGARPDASRNFDGGVAPGVGLIGLQVFQKTSGGEVLADNRNIEKALQWVIDNRARYHIVAVNMSLGSGFYTDPGEVSGDVYRDEISRLESAGVTIVSAAGNNYGIVQDASTGQQQNVEFPNSAAPGIVSTLDVGAVWDANEGNDFIWGNGSVDVTTGPDRVTSFSQRPPTSVGNGIFAPGAIITSTWPGNQLQQSQGTSQAAPMVSGAVALMQDAAQEFGGRFLSPHEVRSILLSTGDTITDGDDENDGVFIDTNGNGQVDSGEIFSLKNTGLSYPRLNVYRAVRRVHDLFLGSTSTNSRDPNGTISGAILGPTLSGAPVDAIEGVLGSDGSRNVGNRDVDFFQFTVASPGQVTIQIAPSRAHPADFNSYLRLFDATGKQLAVNDNVSTSSGWSQIVKALGEGVYYAAVSGAGNTSYNPLTGGGVKPGRTGNFRIGFSLKNSDPNGLISGAVNVNLASAQEGAQVFNGLIGADFGKPVGVSDVDLFKIVVPDNGKLLVNVDTPEASGFVDSYLRVFDDKGNALGANNDGLATDTQGNAVEQTDGTFDYDTSTGQAIGHATDSFASITVKRGDVYYFGVSDSTNRSYNPGTLSGRASGGTGGTYTIDVVFANNDHNGSIPQSVVASSLPVEAQGSIGSDLGDSVGNRDVDMFQVTPTTAGVLRVNVDSYAIPNNSDPVDTVIKLFDSTGTLMATSDDVDGPDPLLQMSVPPNRSYYVAIAGKGNENFDPFVLGSGSPGPTGNYQVSIRTQSPSVIKSLADDQFGDGSIGTITLGKRQLGSIGMDAGLVRGPGDIDLYKFVATRSIPVEVRAVASDSFGADTVLRVFDSNGRQLSYNDNSSTGTVNSRVQVNVVVGRTYYLGVTGAGKAASRYDPRTGVGVGDNTDGSTGGYALLIDGGFAVVRNGLLDVSGTGADDSIGISNRAGVLRVTRNGSTIAFSSKLIRSVQVAAGDGDDRVSLGAGVPGAVIDGGNGNDTLSGGQFSDRIIGGAGRNQLAGGAGNDTISGGDSADAISGNDGNDRIYGNGGNDTLDGGNGSDAIRGGDGNDMLTGRAANDHLFGDSGDDTLTGNAGRDTLDGGDGTDRGVIDSLDVTTSIER